MRHSCPSRYRTRPSAPRPRDPVKQKALRPAPLPMTSADGICPRAAVAAGVLLFCEARRLLQAYTVATRELLWRVSVHLKTRDTLRVAVERLLHTGIGTFQSWADECAYLFASVHGDDVFAQVVTTWMDVFQGRALEVQTRIPVWRKAINPCIPPVCAGKR